MRRALTLARRGWGRTAPNPMVGAVLVRNGNIVGEGWHAEYGGPHAEVTALAAAGDAARGATAYVTLEPCNHQGQTPPCVPALIAAGVARVVYAVPDPNPVAGGGAAALQRAGVAVATDLEADAARELNAPFLHRYRSDRPFVTLKFAMSLDGAIADASRHPSWLTGPQARRAVHRLRAAHDAIAVGSGTAIADDPQLTVRGVRRPRVAPLRIVFDRRGRLPPTLRLVRTADRVPTMVVTGTPAPASANTLAGFGVERLDAESLAGALRALKARGVTSLLCEGGATLGSALLADGLVDRLVIFQAPVLLGAGALPAFGFGSEPSALLVHRWRVVERAALGDDTMTTYAPHDSP